MPLMNAVSNNAKHRDDSREIFLQFVIPPSHVQRITENFSLS
jgi:hypothetical protein